MCARSIKLTEDFLVTSLRHEKSAKYCYQRICSSVPKLTYLKICVSKFHELLVHLPVTVTRSIRFSQRSQQSNMSFAFEFADVIVVLHLTMRKK